MAKTTKPMYARRSLVLGSDGTLQVVYVDIKTGKQLSPAQLKKYQIIGVRNQSDTGGRIGDRNNGNGGGNKDEDKGPPGPEGLKDYNNDGKIDGTDSMLAESDPYSQYFTRSDKMRSSTPAGVQSPTSSTTPGEAYPSAPGTSNTSNTSNTSTPSSTTSSENPGTSSYSANISGSKPAYDQNTRSTEPDSRNNTGFVSGNSYGLNPQVSYTQASAPTAQGLSPGINTENRAFAYNKLSSLDINGEHLSPLASAALAATIERESAYDYADATGDDGNANGGMQWNDRRQAMHAFVGDDWQTDIEGQYGFIQKELSTTENAAFKALQAATTPEEAAKAALSYVRPGVPHYDQRLAATKAIYDEAQRGVYQGFNTQNQVTTGVNPQGTLPGYSQMAPTTAAQGYTPTSVQNIAPQGFLNVEPTMVQSQQMPSNGTTYAVDPTPYNQMSTLGFNPTIAPKTVPTSSFNLDMTPSLNDTGLGFGDFFNPEDLGYSPGQPDNGVTGNDPAVPSLINKDMENNWAQPSYALATAGTQIGMAGTASGNATVTGSPTEMAGLSEGPSGYGSPGLGAPGGGNTGIGYGGLSNTTAGDVSTVDRSGPSNVGGFTDGGFHGITPTNSGVSYGGPNTVGGYNDGGFHSTTPSSTPSVTSNASVGGYTDGGFHNTTPSSNTGFTSSPTNQAERAGF